MLSNSLSFKRYIRKGLKIVSLVFNIAKLNPSTVYPHIHPAPKMLPFNQIHFDQLNILNIKIKISFATLGNLD